MKKSVKTMYTVIDDLFIMIVKNIKLDNDNIENEDNEQDNEQDNDYYNYDIYNR